MDRFFCILEDQECTNCGECEMCDLNKDKICDNCAKCIETESEYRAIEIDKVVDDVIEKD